MSVFIKIIILLLFSSELCAITPIEQFLPLQNFLTNTKNMLLDNGINENTKSYMAVANTLVLFQKIVQTEQSENLQVIWHKFSKLCKSFDQKYMDELEIRDLRTLKNDVAHFAFVIKKYKKCNKLVEHEQIALNNFETLCSALLDEVLRCEYFDFDLSDHMADKFVIQPYEFASRHYLLSSACITPIVLYGIYRALPTTIQSTKQKVLSTYGESAIGNEGYYVPTPKHIDGIPDGVCWYVNTAPQKLQDCVAASLARAIQRVENVPDSRTLEFRTQKYIEWNPLFRRFLDSYKNQGYMTDKERERVKLLLTIPIGNTELFNSMDIMTLRGLMRQIDTKKNLPIKVIDFNSVLMYAQFKTNTDEFKQDIIQESVGFKALRYDSVGSLIHIVFVGLGHTVYYEIQKTSAYNPTQPWFTIRCDDSSSNTDNYRWKTLLLYYLLGDDPNWPNKFPEVKSGL